MSLLQGWEPTPHCFRVHCKNRVDIWTALSFRSGLVRPCGVDNSGQNHPHIFIRRFPSTKTFFFRGSARICPAGVVNVKRQVGSSLRSWSMLLFFVPTLNHVGQISHTRLRCCYDHCQYIRMGAYYYPLGAAWLNCCAPVTWSDGGRVAADRGKGALRKP